MNAPISMQPLKDAGFDIYAPPPYETSSPFQIIGTDSQIVEITVQPGQEVKAEPGALLHMTPDFHASVVGVGCLDCCRRVCCAGESCCSMKFRNDSAQPAQLGLTTNIPGQIIPVDLKKSSGMFVARGSYFATLDPEMNFRVKPVGSCLTGCCGGQGCCLVQVFGNNTVFLNASGTLLQKFLKDGEEIIIDNTSVVAFEQTVQYDVKAAGCGVCCCGGENMFHARLTGPGMIILQSMPIQKIRAALAAPSNRQG